MRNVILAALLAAHSACAALGLGRTPSSRDLSAFAEAVEGMSPDEARKIADKAGIDGKTRLKHVLPKMRALSLDGYVIAADGFANAFDLDRETEVAFAQKTFDELVGQSKCEYAADVAFWFDLGPRYADAAVACLESASKGVYEIAGLACHRPGTEAEVLRRQKAALKTFEAAAPGLRDFDLMRALAAACRYGADDLRTLYRLGLEDGELEFARDVLKQADARGMRWADGARWLELFDAMLAAGRIEPADMLLHEDELPKGPEVLARFKAAAVKHYECGRAVRASMEAKEPDAEIAAIFGHPKCSGADFIEITGGVTEKDAPKYFELALAHGKFTLARRLVDRLPDGKADAFKRAEVAALAAFAFDEVMAFEPFPGEKEADRHERLLGTILAMKEEWFVVRWLKSRRSGWAGYPDVAYAGWVERCFLSALFRGAHELAADVAMEHPSEEFGKKGVALAFEEALEAEDVDGAYAIAKRRKLGDDAMRKAALLKHRLMMREEREKAKLKKRRKRSDDWEARPDP